MEHFKVKIFVLSDFWKSQLQYQRYVFHFFNRIGLVSNLIRGAFLFSLLAKSRNFRESQKSLR